jgi:hypothetical protein
MYTNNELLFPNDVIPVLRDMRGPEWRQLIDKVVTLPASAPEVAALVLMMIKLNGCLECETDSYRAMRGCAMCAIQTLRRYKGSDRDLLQAYDKALMEVREYLSEQVERAARIA